MVLQVAVGVGLEAAAVPLDGLGHRAGMGGEHERGEVPLGRVELELRPDPGPPGRRDRRRPGGGVAGPVRLAAGQSGQRPGAGQQPGPPQQGPPVELLHGLMLGPAPALA